METGKEKAKTRVAGKVVGFVGQTVGNVPLKKSVLEGSPFREVRPGRRLEKESGGRIIREM